MCFTPIISLSVAIIEFILATILILFFKRTTLRNFFILFIFVLGFYQFSEFMLCSTEYSLLWAKIGFITYTFLPGIFLHATLRFLKRKPNIFLIYIVPVVISIIALLTPGFIIEARCETVFVTVTSIFALAYGFLENLPFLIYNCYYFGFIILSLSLIMKDYFHEKNRIKKEIELVEMIGGLLMTVPTLIFIVVLPYLKQRFPSVLCSFALFMAIAAFIAVYLEKKIISKKSSLKSKKKT